MFTQLVASRPSRAQGAEGTAVSLLVHGALITAAVIATAARSAPTTTPRQSFVVPLVAPTTRTPEPARATQRRPPRTEPTPPTPTTLPVEVAPIVAPSDIPSTIPAPTEPSDPGTATDPSATTSGDPTGTPVGSPIGTAPTAYGAESVDIAARLLPRSPLPRYPEMLKSQRLEGGARLRFIVSAEGKVELESVQVLEATHPAFAEAVRAVLPRLRFAPARVGRTPVRQLVEIPFGFQLAP